MINDLCLLRRQNLFRLIILCEEIKNFIDDTNYDDLPWIYSLKIWTGESHQGIVPGKDTV